jgi:short-subunit dehydrogenase
MKTPYTLITGASEGIGKAMARECASRNMNLLLVALPNPSLQATVDEIKNDFPGIAVHALGIDLTEDEAAQEIFDWTQEQGFQVNMLLNNAGMGRHGYYEHVPLQDYLMMLQLNILISVKLIHFFLPQMKAAGKGYILGMSSSEGLLSMPRKSVYSASKRFVFNFYQALYLELKPFGIKVSVVLPGPVPTNAATRRRIETQGRRARFILRSAEEVASQAIDQLLKGRSIIVPGRFLRVVLTLVPLVPHRLKMYLTAKISNGYKEEVEEPQDPEPVAVSSAK